MPAPKLTGNVLEAALAVLEHAASTRADAALRDVLRRSRLEGGEKALVSRAVFAYYRWLGWLDTAKPPSACLKQALELAVAFSQKPSSFSDSDLAERAVPSWVRDVMPLPPALLREWQREPRLWLRVRGGNSRAVADLLGHCEVHPDYPGALWYKGADDLFQTYEFKRGEFEIQDLSSQIVGLLCSPEPGQTWWDACAGEGGKTLHLAELMEGKGTVWASDPAEWRLQKLKKRAARAQVFNYRAKVWTARDQLPTKTQFDGVLVDAPCSGIGTWGRNPHARWTTRPADVDELAEVQRQLLSLAAKAVKPGGRLIYSVCTLAWPETTGVADYLEATQPGFSPIELKDRVSRIELLPQQVHANGMFVAAWSRS